MIESSVLCHLKWLVRSGGKIDTKVILDKVDSLDTVLSVTKQQHKAMDKAGHRIRWDKKSLDIYDMYFSMKMIKDTPNEA